MNETLCFELEKNASFSRLFLAIRRMLHYYVLHSCLNLMLFTLWKKKCTTNWMENSWNDNGSRKNTSIKREISCSVERYCSTSNFLSFQLIAKHRTKRQRTVQKLYLFFFFFFQCFYFTSRICILVLFAFHKDIYGCYSILFWINSRESSKERWTDLFFIELYCLNNSFCVCVCIQKYKYTNMQIHTREKKKNDMHCIHTINFNEKKMSR